jgi:chromo domain-containing protein 1
MDKNEADFDKASEAAENAKELRHLKRIKKRAQIRKRNRPTVIIDDDGEDSEDDIPLAQLSRAGLPKMNPPPAIPTGSQEKRAIDRLFNDSQELPASDLFVKQPLIARKPFLGQSSSENEEEDEDDVSSNIESDDSFLEEIARKAPRKTKTKTNIREKHRRDAEPVLGNSILSPKSSRSRAAGPSTKAITKKAGTHMTVRPTRKIQPSTTGKQAALKSTEVRPAPVGLMVARRKANVNVATAPAAKTAIRRSGEGGKTSTSSAIKIFHGPKTKQRKEWNTEDRQYTKMRYRGIAEKRGRVEATPELNELDFPAGRAPTSLSKLNPRAPDEDIYGRREGGNRRIQEIEADLPSGPGEADALDPLQDWQADKVPLMCYDWRSSNSCRNGPIKCKFMHRDKDENGRDYPYGDASGSIPPKFRKPQITCFYWLTKSYGCNKPPELCLYAHRNTGYSPKTGSHDGEIVKIDSTLEPFSERKVRTLLH